jgi:hypothetical protein
MTNSLSLTWPISSVLQTKAAIFRFIIVLYIRYLTNHLTSSATSYKFYSSQNGLLLEAAVLSTFDEYEMVVQLQVRTSITPSHFTRLNSILIISRMTTK